MAPKELGGGTTPNRYGTSGSTCLLSPADPPLGTSSRTESQRGTQCSVSVRSFRHKNVFVTRVEKSVSHRIHQVDSLISTSLKLCCVFLMLLQCAGTLPSVP